MASAADERIQSLGQAPPDGDIPGTPRISKSGDSSKVSTSNSYSFIWELYIQCTSSCHDTPRRNFPQISKAKAVLFELKSTSPHPNPFLDRLNCFDLAGLTPVFITTDRTSSSHLIPVQIGFERVVVLPVIHYKVNTERRYPTISRQWYIHLCILVRG